MKVEKKMNYDIILFKLYNYEIIKSNINEMNPNYYYLKIYSKIVKSNTEIRKGI